jgi:hypothetical protein
MRIANLLMAVVLAAGVSTGARAAATDEEETLAVVNKFLAGFNTGNDRAMLATCAEQMTIIDDIAPHVWQGPTACREWKKAVDAFLAVAEETHVTVTLGKPSHNEVTGDRAYIVAPLTFSYSHLGRPVVDTGSLMIVSLHKSAAGWQMTGWACAEHP